MKYTNLLSKVGKIAWNSFHVLLILISLAIFGAMVFFSFWMQTLILAVIMMPPMIVFLGLVLNFELEILAGSELYNTGIVYEGNSLIGVKKGLGYYKRKRFIDFFQCSLFIGYLVYFICNMRFEMGWAIAGAVVCVVGGCLYFLAGLSSIEKNKLVNSENHLRY